MRISRSPVSATADAPRTQPARLESMRMRTLCKGGVRRRASSRRSSGACRLPRNLYPIGSGRGGRRRSRGGGLAGPGARRNGHGVSVFGLQRGQGRSHAPELGVPGVPGRAGACSRGRERSCGRTSLRVRTGAEEGAALRGRAGGLDAERSGAVAGRRALRLPRLQTARASRARSQHSLEQKALPDSQQVHAVRPLSPQGRGGERRPVYTNRFNRAR